MAKIYWANLLHFYQPPIQIPEVLRKIVVESIRQYIIRRLAAPPQSKLKPPPA